MSNASGTNETTPVKEPAESVGWAKSRSKQVLRRRILNGDITMKMKPKTAFHMDYDVHKEWEKPAKRYDSWAGGFNRLRNAIDRDKGRMIKDVQQFAQDMAIVKRIRDQNPSAQPRWYGSKAEKLLAQDVKDGKHLEMKPRFLHTTKDEYKVFDLDVFRKHIYQEKDKTAKRDKRFEKKKKAWKYPELHEDHPRLQGDSSDDSSDDESDT